MSGRLAAVLASVVIAVALPPTAHAIDHVALDISSAKFAPARIKVKGKNKLQPNPLAQWLLSAQAFPADYDPSRVGEGNFSVVLGRAFLRGRAAENHFLRGSITGALTFDGRTGRWTTGQPGSALVVNMTLTAAGAAQPVGEAFGCRGAFVRAGVVLRGRFALRTGTRFFKTITVRRLRGTVTYNQGGPVDCSFIPPASCTQRRSFSATGSAGFVGTIGGGAGLSVGFRDDPANPFVGWSHAMIAPRFDPIVGELPNFEIRVPSGMPVTGSGAFTASQISESAFGGCRVLVAQGTFAGTFRVRFTGWGARTIALTPAASASYAEYR